MQEAARRGRPKLVRKACRLPRPSRFAAGRALCRVQTRLSPIRRQRAAAQKWTANRAMPRWEI